MAASHMDIVSHFARNELDFVEWFECAVEKVINK